ncbi:hypothetical protein OROHE_002314 [Orobanche hederae]
MGVKSILKELCPCKDVVEFNPEELRGLKVGIDASGWIYKCMLSGPTKKFINSVPHKELESMLQFGIIPFVIFDGANLYCYDDPNTPAKLRNKNKELKNLCGAGMFNLTYSIIMALKHLDGVSFVGAPYEADAQLAYMSFRGDFNVVITDDSDLIAYGCKKIFYKLEIKNGTPWRCNLYMRQPTLQKERLMGLNEDQLLQVFVLAGTDYLENIPHIGFRKAVEYVKNYHDYEKVIKALRVDKIFKTSVPSNYEEKVKIVLMIFKHQRVVDMRTAQLVHLTPVKDADLQEAGSKFGHALNFLGVGCGYMNPHTYQVKEKIKEVVEAREKLKKELDEEMELHPEAKTRAEELDKNLEKMMLKKLKNLYATMGEVKTQQSIKYFFKSQ